MELLVTLSNIDGLSKISQSGIDGIIFGSVFSARFSYAYKDFKLINDTCIQKGLKRYISIDAFISEDDKGALYDYMEYLKGLNPDGIYFTDLGVINVAKSVGIAEKLIYDPDTLITNSLDANFFIKQGYGVVLSRELTIKEVIDILKNNPKEVDMQIFGHLKMSYSKRKFLSNYFSHIGVKTDIDDKKDIRLIEENREYALPVIENKYGTRIYTDYCLLMYKELAYIKYVIKRLIIDDNFIDDVSVILAIIRDINRLTVDNADFLIEALIKKYPKINFQTGYLYNKTVKVKEENE